MKEATKFAVYQFNEILSKTRFPTVHVKAFSEKLKLCWESKCNVCCDVKRRGSGPTQQALETEFENSTEQLFNEVHHAIESMKIGKDRKHLLDQRGERKMYMEKVDEKLAAMEDDRSSILKKERKKLG
jgi:hypothetical protein